MPNDQANNHLLVLVGVILDLQDLMSETKHRQIPLSSKMARLKQLGLENAEIAKLFGKKSDEVAKLIYETKRKTKK